MRTSIEDKIQDIYKRHDICYEYYITSKTECEILVDWGDWKHDHAYIDYLMKVNGFKKVGEELTEVDGSDCYSSVHSYQLSRYCRK